jgi:hypothetical protein
VNGREDRDKHRTPNTERRTSKADRSEWEWRKSEEQGAGKVGVLEYWSAGAAKKQTK